MKFLENMRKRRKLFKALKNIEEPLWWVTYTMNDGEQSVVNVFAPNYREASNRASDILLYKCDSSFKIITMSTLGKIPDDMEVVFNPVRRPSSLEKADLAQRYTQPVLDAYQAGIIGKSTVLRELKQQSTISSCWTNITDEMIEEAEKEDEEAKAQKQQEEEELENAANNAIKEDGSNEVSGKHEEEKETV